eukprot:3245945-Pyramimonas_sp.AAC.1
MTQPLPGACTTPAPNTWPIDHAKAALTACLSSSLAADAKRENGSCFSHTSELLVTSSAYSASPQSNLLYCTAASPRVVLRSNTCPSQRRVAPPQARRSSAIR